MNKSACDLDVDGMVDELSNEVARRERLPERRELLGLIESDRHVLIGAKALALYTEPRFTEDSDYVVAGRTFQRIRKWVREKGIPVEDLGLVLRLQSLAVDVIDGRSNAVLKEILKRESPKPSPEALAAAKYISFVNQQRGPRRLQDVADFGKLVTLPQFGSEKLKSYLVAEYAAQWPEVSKLIEDIRSGRPITI